MDSDKAVTAIFEALPSFTLTVNVIGNGLITPAGGSFASNSAVSLAASPSNGCVFHHWEGDATGSSNPLSVTMTMNKTITGVFIQPLSITAEPQDTTVPAGGTVTFSVGVAGTGPTSYEWRFNGAAIGGAAAATLILTNVQTANAGNYQAIVTGPYGSVTSRMAALVVNFVGSNIVSTASDADLRSAIELGGNVRLCFSGTVVLTNTIQVSRNTTIDASGVAVTISGNNAVRLFNVSPGIAFTITNVILANGRIAGPNGTNAAAPAPVQFAEAGKPGDGASIYNNGGMLRLVACILRDNAAVGGNGGSGTQQGGGNYSAPGGPGRGGAIFNNAGEIDMLDCVLSDNVCLGGNGGNGPSSNPVEAAGGSGLGGAIFNGNGMLHLIRCTLTNNSATGGQAVDGVSRGGDSGGGAIYTGAGTLAISNSTLGGNFAAVFSGGSSLNASTNTAARGGAVFQAGGVLFIDLSALRSNAARGGDSPAGGFQTWPGMAAGGGAWLDSGTAWVSRCSVSDNAALGGNAYRNSGTGAGSGGGILNRGILHIIESAVSGNRAAAGSGSSLNASGFGGGVYNSGTGVVERSLFLTNQASGGSAGIFAGISWPGADGFGGAVCNSGSLVLTNCTVGQNTVRGGIPSVISFTGIATAHAGNAFGGGLYSATGAVMAVNVTISGNSATPGGFTVGDGGAGYGANIAITNGLLTLRNSLIAYPGTNVNVWGSVTDEGYNICSDASAAFNSGASFNSTDPKLLPLADNGGPTLTMALEADSPAIDWAPVAGAPKTDQRGYPRPAGPGVDLGAFEAGSTSLNLTLSARRIGQIIEISFPASPSVVYELQRSHDLIAWEQQEVIGPFTTNVVIMRNIQESQPRQLFRVRVSP